MPESKGSGLHLAPGHVARRWSQRARHARVMSAVTAQLGHVFRGLAGRAAVIAELAAFRHRAQTDLVLALLGFGHSKPPVASVDVLPGQGCHFGNTAPG